MSMLSTPLVHEFSAESDAFKETPVVRLPWSVRDYLTKTTRD
jgi:hypothetical protein